jgi:hypothetical protein
MGVESWDGNVSTPTLALPLQGGGNEIANYLVLSVFHPCVSVADFFFHFCAAVNFAFASAQAWQAS